MQTFVNGVRLFHLIQSGVSVTLAALVVYQAGLSRTKPGGPPSLLFWHIIVISIGTEGMVVTAAVWTFMHLGDTFTTWLLIPHLTFTFLISVAMVIILKVQRARMAAQEQIMTSTQRISDLIDGVD